MDASVPMNSFMLANTHRGCCIFFFFGGANQLDSILVSFLFFFFLNSKDVYTMVLARLVQSQKPRDWLDAAQ